MKKREKLKGDSLSIVDMNYMLYSQGDPDAIYPSPEVDKMLKEVWKEMRLKEIKPTGEIIVFGTGGGFKQTK